MLISDNHITIETANHVKDICAPLRSQGIDYFHFARRYKDNSLSALVTNVDWHKHAFETELLATTNLDKLKSGYYLWENVCSDKLLADAQEKLNLDHAVTVLKKGDGFYDVFAFGATSESNFSSKVYFNHQSTFEKFISYFKEKSQPLFNQVDDDRIQLSDNMISQGSQLIANHNLELLDAELNKLTSELNRPAISERELECLSYLIKGHTAKEIGEFLEISRRTVETYIDRIRIKLGCNRKGELIYKALTQNFCGELI